MKPLLLWMTITLIAQFSYGQVQSNCTDNAALIANAYERDIHFLAIQRLQALQHPDTSQIIVPQIHKDSIIRAMAAIFNLGTQLQADSVFNYHCIHSVDSRVDSLFVKIDPAIPWTNSWQLGQTNTSNTAINQFLSTYGFTVTNYYPSLEWVTLYSPQILTINWNAVRDSLRTFNGILDIYPDVAFQPFGGPYGLIYYSTDVIGNASMAFFLRWEFDGNNFRRWKYTINNNCQITGSDTLYNINYPNSPIPTPSNCLLGPSTIQKFSIKDLKVYPNPASDYITISTKEKGQITLRDLTGRDLKQIEHRKYSTTIDLSEQADGIYLLDFVTDNGRAIQKIIKQ